jgi:hypothetical protein
MAAGNANRISDMPVNEGAKRNDEGKPALDSSAGGWHSMSGILL